jgi:hypothetical protein
MPRSEAEILHNLTKKPLVLFSLLLLFSINAGLIVAQRSYAYPKEGSYATYECWSEGYPVQLKNWTDFTYDNVHIIYYWKIIEINNTGMRVFVKVNASYDEKYTGYVKRFPPLSRSDVVEFTEGPRNVSFNGTIFVNLEKEEAYYGNMSIEPPRFWWPVDLTDREKIKFGRAPDRTPLEWEVHVCPDFLPDPQTGVYVKAPEIKTPLGTRKYSDIAFIESYTYDPVWQRGYLEAIFVDRITGIALGSVSYYDGVLGLMGIYGISGTKFANIDKTMHVSCIMRDAYINGTEVIVLKGKSSEEPFIIIFIILCMVIPYVYYRIRRSSKKVWKSDRAGQRHPEN